MDTIQVMRTRHCDRCDTWLGPIKGHELSKIWVDRDGITPHKRLCHSCVVDGWGFGRDGAIVQTGVVVQGVGVIGDAR